MDFRRGSSAQGRVRPRAVVVGDPPADAVVGLWPAAGFAVTLPPDSPHS